MYKFIYVKGKCRKQNSYGFKIMNKLGSYPANFQNPLNHLSLRVPPKEGKFVIFPFVIDEQSSKIGSFRRFHP